MTNELNELEVRQIKKVVTTLDKLTDKWDKLSLNTILSVMDTVDFSNGQGDVGLLFQDIASCLINYANGQLTCCNCGTVFTPKHKGKNQRWCSKCSRNARQREWRARKYVKLTEAVDAMEKNEAKVDKLIRQLNEGGAGEVATTGNGV